MDGRANALVSIATAQISAHRIVDIPIGWFAIRAQQANRSHHLTGLAVPALRNV